MDSEEAPLGGGYSNAVVRVGDTVRRQMRQPRPFVHELLRFFEDRGWPGAPRFLGIDEHGREVLSWTDGHVPWVGIDEPPEVWSEEGMARVAELVRQFHDLTAGTSLAGDEEVVCHNDLSPRNTVYRPLPVGFIDWDLAAPGRRVHDVAIVCWQWAASTTSTVEDACRLVRVAADAYGITDADRAELVETILWWQDRCWRGIQAMIDAGDPAADRLAAADAVPAVQADWAWTTRHRTELERALGRS